LCSRYFPLQYIIQITANKCCLKPAFLAMPLVVFLATSFCYPCLTSPLLNSISWLQLPISPDSKLGFGIVNHLNQKIMTPLAKYQKLLVLFSGYCFVLLFFRMSFTASITYAFLLWNLFLAYIPYTISYFLQVKRHPRKTDIIWGLTWLFFLPNAPYIVTDFFHLHQASLVPRWFDLLLLASFSLNGMLLYWLSMHHFLQHLRLKHAFNYAWIMVFICSLLVGLGVYMGRFLRYNSWDLLHQPQRILNDLVDRLLHPMQHLETWGFTLGFGLFYFLSFGLIHFLIDSISLQKQPLISPNK